jgi:hypothetical protein
MGDGKMPRYGDSIKEDLYEQIDSALYGVDELKGLKMLAEIFADRLEGYELNLTETLQGKEEEVRTFIHTLVHSDKDRETMRNELMEFVDNWDLQR